MNFDSLKKALLAGTLILPALTLPVMAAPPSLMAPVSDNITAYPPDPTLASFYINYVDASGATIDYQVIRYPSEGTAVLDQTDLNIPDGFYLNEWGEYYAEPGAWNYMDLQVIPNDPALAAALSSADGLSTMKLSWSMVSIMFLMFQKDIRLFQMPMMLIPYQCIKDS